MKPIETITINGADGVTISLSVDESNMTHAELAALRKLIASSGDPKSLNSSERKLMASKKAYFRRGGPDAFIARFDLSFVRID